MKWTPGGESSNIEDQRGSGGGLPLGRMGIGGTIVLLVLSLLFRRNLFNLVGGEDHQGAATGEDKELVEFVSFVLDDTQKNWQKVLPAQTGVGYQDAKLVLFTDSVRSGCGYAESAMGPFYCPADRKVYIDLGFYRALKQKLGAPGDFAQAYVIAHELGHHVQNLLGTDAQMRDKQRGMSKTQQNDLSVRLELQADCYAGVWANSTSERKLLEEGDVEEAMNAAAAVGDDRLEKSAGAEVNPERWTHGSSAMRVRWFKRGMASGKVSDCDTFGASSL